MTQKHHVSVKAEATAAKAKGKDAAKRPKRKRWRTAAESDKYQLYEMSVQEPSAECDLVDQVWKERRKRKCVHIREDFCGTAAVCVEWVKRSRTHTAIGVDLDAEVLERAIQKMHRKLKPAQRKRMTLVRDDVRTVDARKVDSVLAMNFSYFIFKTRDALNGYFRSVHRSLVSDGMLLMDAYGGSDSFLEIEEDRNFDGFTYLWDQAHFNPITHEVVNHIHFEFPDGTKLQKAFTYEWRLWTLPELRDALLEVGFKDVNVYWEGTDKKTGEGDGNWTLSTRGEACQGWVAYIVAEK